MLIVTGLVLVALGLVGIVAPGVPGTALIFGGILLMAWADGFARIGVPSLIAVGALAVAATVLDYVASILGARRAGASAWGLVGAVVGLVAGLPFGIPGIALGPAVGAVAFEFLKGRNLRLAGRAGVGVLAGFIFGTVVKYAVAMAMLGIALLAFLW